MKKNQLSYLFLQPQISQNCTLFYVSESEEKNLGKFSKYYITFYPKNCQKYGFGIRDSGSGKNLFRIPDPGVKKAPAPGSGSATLLVSYFTTRNIKTLPFLEEKSLERQLRNTFVQKITFQVGLPHGQACLDKHRSSSSLLCLLCPCLETLGSCPCWSENLTQRLRYKILATRPEKDA